MDAREIQAEIQSYDELSEVQRVYNFEAVRKNEILKIKVYDNGDDPNLHRYSVAVTSESGKGASGNSGNCLKTVLATVHWYELDKWHRDDSSKPTG